MNIIYVSSLLSKNKTEYILNNTNAKLLQSIQRYHRLLCEGIAQNNCNVKTISAIPITAKDSNKKFWGFKDEMDANVKYQYIPFINVSILRQICLIFFYAFICFKRNNYI